MTRWPLVFLLSAGMVLLCSCAMHRNTDLPFAGDVEAPAKKYRIGNVRLLGSSEVHTVQGFGTDIGGELLSDPAGVLRSHGASRLPHFFTEDREGIQVDCEIRLLIYRRHMPGVGGSMVFPVIPQGPAFAGAFQVRSKIAGQEWTNFGMYRFCITRFYPSVLLPFLFLVAPSLEWRWMPPVEFARDCHIDAIACSMAKVLTNSPRQLHNSSIMVTKEGVEDLALFGNYRGYWDKRLCGD